MSFDIYAQILSAQNGAEDTMLALIERFAPALKKYTGALGYEDAYNDLVVCFIDIVQHIDLDKMRAVEDPVLVKYLYSVIYHEYIKLSKRRRADDMNTLLVEDIDDSATCISENGYLYDNYNSLLFNEISILLTSTEAEIVRQIYFMGNTIQEIADMRKTTRQSVNKIKLRALKKLRTYFTQL